MSTTACSASPRRAAALASEPHLRHLDRPGDPAAPGAAASPAARGMAWVRLQGFKIGLTHAGNGDLCFNLRTPGAVLAAFTRAAADHGEPGGYLLPALDTQAPPRVTRAGISIQRLEPSCSHDRRGRLVGPPGMPGTCLLVGTRRAVTAATADSAPDVVQVGRDLSTAGHTPALPRLCGPARVGHKRRKPGLAHRLGRSFGRPPRELSYRLARHNQEVHHEGPTAVTTDTLRPQRHGCVRALPPPGQRPSAAAAMMW